MAALDFARPLLVMLLCLITAITSSVSVGPDVTFSAPSLSNQAAPLSAMVKHSLIDIDNDKRMSKNFTVMMEGGPVPGSIVIQQANIETVTESDGSKVRQNMPRVRYAASSVVARKGVEEKKVKPRKGVNQTTQDTDQAAILFNQTTLEDTKPIVESISSTAAIHDNNHVKISNIDNMSKNTTDLHSNGGLNHGANSSSTSTSANVTTVITNNTTVSKSSSHIPKPKPTVTTIGKSEINESRLPSRTKNPPLGMPRKIDYIVPVIITIVALPLLGTAIFILYRRGRDCWDKRHYRRMDFLIDGMYND